MENEKGEMDKRDRMNSSTARSWSGTQVGFWFGVKRIKFSFRLTEAR